MIKNKRQLIIAGGSICIILLVIISLSLNNKKINQEVTTAYQEDTLQEDTLQEAVVSGLTQEDTAVSDTINKDSLGEESLATITANSGSEGMAVVDENIEKEFSDDPIEEAVINDINTLVKSYYDTSKKLSEAIVIVEDKAMLDEIEESRKAIEKYKNLETYVKRGLELNSYIVFATYEMKLEQIETAAPGMSMLYLVTDEEGRLRVQDHMTDEVNTYAAKLIEKEELKAIIDTVNTKLAEAVKKDDKLKEFIKYLKKDL